MEIRIGLESDGWTAVLPSGKSFSWNHNEEDLGASALKELLQYLDHDVEIEEWY